MESYVRDSNFKIKVGQDSSKKKPLYSETSASVLYKRGERIQRQQVPFHQKAAPIKKGDKFRQILAAFLFVLGLSIIAYPHVAQYINNLNATRLVTEYLSASPSSVENGDGGVVGTSDSEESFPGGFDEDMFGGIVIPKLNLKLPIYVGSTDANLSKGIAHLEGSSLPVGGVSTHSVLCGHNGSVINEWFTHIDGLEDGDLFYVQTREQTLEYRVISEKVISPKDVSELVINEGRDLVTLLTCTESGTMRLIVTGERVL